MIDLRQHWPVLVVAVLGLVGYLDLKFSLVELTAGLEAPPVHSRDAENVVNEAASVEQEAPPEALPEAPPERLPLPRAEWVCQGVIGPEILREAIGAQAGTVLGCHQQVYAGTADPPRGTLTIELRIGESGSPLDAHVGGPLQDPQLLECIQRAAATWQFPPPVGGDCAIISAPFQLGAAE